MLTQTFEEWLTTTFRPIMGGETPPAETETEETEETETGPAGEEETTEESSEEESSEESEGEEDELSTLKSQLKATQQELTAAQIAIRKAKEEGRKARQEAAKKGGNWEQLAKEREAEVADLTERVQKSELDAATAKDELDSFRREVRVTRLSSKLSFRDPSDAIAALRDKPDDTGDDKSCERALRKLAESKPYLVDQKRAHGRAMNGDADGGSFFTKEQMEKMTPMEIAANQEKIDRSLAHLAISRG